ncbi:MULTISPECIES: DUF2057 family protein [unclassified Brenneria]|uniref:DUF2057 family protein n=1 Tax=unclassified Brenneria TaxID=2634434 RepID=UPI0029C36151|nr:MULTISPECIES: DUF2057 family protein [unclassified Brenneria]MDX5627334.1 DUF2057 family protein [Brenneria sp. L3-3Z]MDX5694510.1 DUF2057 family protein [Brenneria sp. L4-2C]MEE3661866.1 DUF2057 family protein [Brenneria sp. g21c3]
MKAGLITACLFISVISAPAIAITLKLDQNIDLIVVDGQKVSSTILKGADSLELDNGQHQLLFKVVKDIRTINNVRTTYTSPALIAAFNAQNLASVSFKLPSLETSQERKNFDQQAHYQLIDERQQIIPTRVDILNVTDDELTQKIEEKMSEYNSAKHRASVAQFAAIMTSTNDDLLEDGPVTDKLDAPTASSTLFSIMQYWFQKADKETQQRFLRWVHEKDTH